MAKKPTGPIDVQKAVALASKNWWKSRPNAPIGVTVQPDGDGIFIADGAAAWYFEGADAEWATLTLKADAIAHNAEGLSKGDIRGIIDRVPPSASVMLPTKLCMTTLDSFNEQRYVRLFVGPNDAAVWFADALFGPIADVMSIFWRMNGSKPEAGSPMIGSLLTGDICAIMPIDIPGDHTALARGWREWNNGGVKHSKPTEQEEAPESDSTDIVLPNRELVPA